MYDASQQPDGGQVESQTERFGKGKTNPEPEESDESLSNQPGGVETESQIDYFGM